MDMESLMRFPRHLVGDEINEYAYTELVKWLGTYGYSQEEVVIVLNSGGGRIVHMLGMYDAIQIFPGTVHVLALGHCMSAAVTLMMATDRKRRYAGRNTRFMTHAVRQVQEETVLPCSVEPPSEEALKAYDQLTGANMTETYELHERQIQLLMQGTRLPEETVRELVGSDRFFWPEEALRLGIIGEIIEPKSKDSPPEHPTLW